MYFWREERGDYINPAEMSSCNYGNRDTYRAQYLKELLQPSYSLRSFEGYPTVLITWEGPASYKQGVVEVVKAERDKFQWLMEFLKDAGLLTTEEAATLQPRAEVVVADHRNNREIPLPRILEDGEGLTIRASFTQPLD